MIVDGTRYAVHLMRRKSEQNCYGIFVIFFPNKNNVLRLQNCNFSDIWNATCSGERVFLQSYNFPGFNQVEKKISYKKKEDFHYSNPYLLHQHDLPSTLRPMPNTPPPYLFISCHTLHKQYNKHLSVFSKPNKNAYHRRWWGRERSRQILIRSGGWRSARLIIG